METCLKILHTKFKVDISIFGKHRAQKPSPLMPYFVQAAILSIFMHRTEIKMTFLNPEIKLVQKTHFWFEKKRNFDMLWPGFDPILLCCWLSWTQIAKWPRFVNSTCKIDYKSCAACPKKTFWFVDLSWPFVTWSWPWPVLSMTFMLTGYLH